VEKVRSIFGTILPSPRQIEKSFPRTAAIRYIYFIRQDDVVKIGITTDVKKRLGILRTQGSSSSPMLLLTSFPGDRDDEAGLHRRFDHLRSHDEWFRAEPELLELIAAFDTPASEPAPGALLAFLSEDA